MVSDIIVTSLSEAFVVAGAELSHEFMDVNAHFQQGMFQCPLHSQSFMLVVQSFISFNTMTPT